MLTKIKKLTLIILLVLPAFLVVQPQGVLADHTTTHCQEQHGPSLGGGNPSYNACAENIPVTFSDWGAYCSQGGATDSQYSSCMQTYAGGESPPGSLEGSWCTSGGNVTYYYDRATCPAGSRTNDVPVTFERGGVWCAINAGAQGVITTFIVGGTCAPSSFTSPTSNPFPAGSRENPNGTVADPGDDDDGGASGGSTGGGFAQNRGPAEGFLLDPNSAAPLDTPDQIPTDTPVYQWLLTIVDFMNIGVSIVGAITVAISGFQYMASRGDPNKTAKAIGRLSQVGLAIVVYVLGWALLNWLVPGGALNTTRGDTILTQQHSYTRSYEHNV